MFTMGIFSHSSPFDADVEKATDEKNTSEEWGCIMDICDRVGNNSQNAKDCLRSIMKRLGHQDPHIALHAITLLDACVNNCGKVFHLEVASRDFETEFKKLLGKSHPSVVEKLKQLLRNWAEGDFRSDPQLILIPSLYQKLKQDGMDFSRAPSTSKGGPKSSQLPKDPNAVVSQQEVEDIAKAIELSLKETTSSPKSKGGSGTSSSNTSSLYPATSLNSVPEGRKVRALYDFEAAEDNELTFKAGEIIHVTDDSDPNWWKGHNKRGEGLFPSNFVTADLSVEPESLKSDIKKSVQFNDNVSVKNIKKEPLEVEINESKMDQLLHYLHEADPRDSRGDPLDMHELEDEVNAMGPLIDTELERVDTKHAQLTKLSSDLVEALNLYHSLMREPPGPGSNFQPIPKPPYGYLPQAPNQFNGGPGPSNPNFISQPFPGALPPHPNGPIPHFIPEQTGSLPVNGMPSYGHPGAGPPQPFPISGVGPQMPQGTPLGPVPHPNPSAHPSYHQNNSNNPPLL